MTDWKQQIASGETVSGRHSDSRNDSWWERERGKTMYLCSRLSFLCSWEDGHHGKMLTLFPLLRKFLDVPAQGMAASSPLPRMPAGELGFLFLRHFWLQEVYLSVSQWIPHLRKLRSSLGPVQRDWNLWPMSRQNAGCVWGSFRSFSSSSCSGNVSYVTVSRKLDYSYSMAWVSWGPKLCLWYSFCEKTHSEF